MKYSEWFNEARYGGSYGSVRIGPKRIRARTNGVVLFRALVALLLIATYYYVAIQFYPMLRGEDLMVLSVGLLAYSLLGFFVTPEPDVTNMGYEYIGFDNPFRISDDVNRLLAHLRVVLYPGGFIISALVHLFIIFHLWRVSEEE